MRELMAITKALADENRIRILAALKDRELCVCQLIELLGLAPSTTSKHISILKQARLIDCHKEGRWVMCRLAGKYAPEAAKKALAWIKAALAGDRQIESDRKRLEEILNIYREELCRRQKGK